MFTIHWGKNLTIWGKIIAFFVVLPIAVFVPFLTWIESFRFNWLNKIFSYLHLHVENFTDENDLREFEEGGGDLLYKYIEKKFQSHSGLLVEALAEAIPQAILQTIAVLYFGEASLLFVISIFASICVITSKGYLISYSMHRPTFAFNAISVLADALCMFATVCWLFSREGEGSDDSEAFIDMNDWMKATWLYLIYSTSSLGIVSFGVYACFRALDQHHQVDLRMPIAGKYYYSTCHVCTIYVTNMLGAFFLLVPALVVMMNFKFCLLVPVLMNDYQTCCNEFARFKRFYVALHEFILGDLPDLKLLIANRVLLSESAIMLFLISIIYYL